MDTWPFPYLGYYEPCCNGHGSTDFSLITCFLCLWEYTWKWAAASCLCYFSGLPTFSSPLQLLPSFLASMMLTKSSFWDTNLTVLFSHLKPNEGSLLHSVYIPSSWIWPKIISRNQPLPSLGLICAQCLHQTHSYTSAQWLTACLQVHECSD